MACQTELANQIMKYCQRIISDIDFSMADRWDVYGLYDAIILTTEMTTELSLTKSSNGRRNVMLTVDVAFTNRSTEELRAYWRHNQLRCGIPGFDAVIHTSKLFS